MNLRSAIHARPGVTIGVCIALVLVGGYFVVRGTRGTSSMPHYPNWGNYYTADDGQTWIADTWTQVAPFDRDGKTYVRVWVFKCGDKVYAGYLEKFTPEAQADILSQEEERLKIVRIQELGDHALLVKRPGEANWVAKDSTEGELITRVVCPDNQEPTKVLPDLPVP